jgi:hypothetical protein
MYAEGERKSTLYMTSLKILPGVCTRLQEEDRRNMQKYTLSSTVSTL